MNTITQTQTHSNHPNATSLSQLDTQATAQSDISIKMIPVSMLVVSELNVRKNKASKADDESLQASILAHGIIQNLVSLPIVDGVYPVVAGGRRLTQLNALVDAKKIEPDHLVPVKVLNKEEARLYSSEISLTENVTRAAMHPVDEFEAYTKMTNEGATVGEVAQRFGKTQLYVHQRMKLAAVIAPVLEAYREGETTLERVMLFTIASPERQTEVWERVKNQSYYNENQLRSMLKEQAIEANHHLVKFVGQEDYERAGGVVTSDLFSDKSYFEDRALIESLAIAKIQTEADKLISQGWKWTDILLQRTFDESRGYLELTPNKGQYKKAEKALAGCILVLDYKGEVQVIKGLVAKSERKALKALQSNQAKSSGTTPDTNNTVKADYSTALVEDLKAHRLVMAKHTMMLNSSLAIDALHFSLCAKIFTPHSSTPIDVSLNQTHVEPKQGDFNENTALALIEAHKESLNSSWLEPDSLQARFKAFIALEADEKQKLVAFATSLMLKPSLAQDNDQFGFEFLFELLNFDAAEYWRPTTNSFLKRIDKNALINIASPVMSDDWCKGANSLKKGDLVKQLDEWLCGGDDSLTEVQKMHFSQWMPTGF